MIKVPAFAKFRYMYFFRIFFTHFLIDLAAHSWLVSILINQFLFLLNLQNSGVCILCIKIFHGIEYPDKSSLSPGFWKISMGYIQNVGILDNSNFLSWIAKRLYFVWFATHKCHIKNFQWFKIKLNFYRNWWQNIIFHTFFKTVLCRVCFILFWHTVLQNEFISVWCFPFRKS